MGSHPECLRLAIAWFNAIGAMDPTLSRILHVGPSESDPQSPSNSTRSHHALSLQVEIKAVAKQLAIVPLSENCLFTGMAWLVMVFLGLV